MCYGNPTKSETVSDANLKERTMLDLVKIEAHLWGDWEKRLHRSPERIKATAEVFTPRFMVQEMLDKIDECLKDGEKDYRDPATRILDPAAGDGNFLAEVLLRRLQAGVPLCDALETIHGIELQEDNALLCRERLACGDEAARAITDRTVAHADALTYLWCHPDPFDGKPFDFERAKRMDAEKKKADAKAAAAAKRAAKKREQRPVRGGGGMTAPYATVYIRRQPGQKLKAWLSLPFTIESRSYSGAKTAQDVLNIMGGGKISLGEPGDLDGRYLIDGSMHYRTALRMFGDECILPLTVEGLFKFEFAEKRRGNQGESK